MKAHESISIKIYLHTHAVTIHKQYTMGQTTFTVAPPHCGHASQAYTTNT